MDFRGVNELVVGLNAAHQRDMASNTTNVYDSGLSLQNAALWVDYVYLDTDERRRFAQIDMSVKVF